MAAGGYNDDDDELDNVEIIDMQTRTWNHVTNITGNRFFHGGAIIGQFMNSCHKVVTGGYDTDGKKMEIL